MPSLSPSDFFHFAIRAYLLARIGRVFLLSESKTIILFRGIANVLVPFFVVAERTQAKKFNGTIDSL